MGPISSCHPRSKVRVANRREDIKEAISIIEWIMSTKNHCIVEVCRIVLLEEEEVKKFIEVNRIMTPDIVTTKGSLLSREDTLNDGASIINRVKNHPAIIVPADSRKRAFVSLLFSSPTGDREFNEGLSIKQKKTIRNL